MAQARGGGAQFLPEAQDSTSCNVTVNALERAALWQRALTVLENMHVLKLAPNNATYSSLITACKERGEWEAIWTGPWSDRDVCVACAIGPLQQCIGQNSFSTRSELTLDP